MSIQHMILGCLMDAPSHGYEIRKRIKELFQRSHDINEGQFYAVLRKMEAEGLVKKEVVLQDKNPPRNMFYVSDKGKEELFAWLINDSSPYDITRFDFYQAFPFLERCNYFKHLTDETALQLVEKQMAWEQEKLDEYARVEENMKTLKLNWYRIGIIEFGRAFQETKLEWLMDMKRKLLAQKSESPLRPEDL